MESYPPSFKLISIKANQKVTNMTGWSKKAERAVIDCLDELTRKSNGNYGVLCGPRSGILVIDYDLDKVPEITYINIESLKELHGDTMIVQTPKGGFHVYHKYDERFDSWVGRCGLNNWGGFKAGETGFIDVRTHGNYVVGSGSIVNGKSYVTVNDVEPARMPDNMFEAFDEFAHGAKYSRGQSLEVSKYEDLLENHGFTNISWVNEYNFDCDQRGRGTTCPLCSLTHESNHFFLSEFEGAVFLKNHSNRCKRVCIAQKEIEYTEKCIIEDNEVTYESIKKTIDKTVFKVLNPLCYCIKRSENRLQMCTFKQLREIHSTYVLTDSKGKSYNFFDKWSTDPTKVEYDNMDFFPPPLTCPSKTYNMWTGFHFSECEEDIGTVEPFLELMSLVQGGEEYMIHYLADLVQNPGKLPEVGIILRGLEGTGKNSITEVISRLIGSEHYFSTTDPLLDVFGRFSEARYRKLCINFDEAEAKKMFSLNENIKGLITSPYLNYEQKGVTPIRVRSFSRVIVTTNNQTPLKMSQTDRRWCVFDMSEKFIKNREHWDTFYKWLNDPKNIKSVYEHIMKIDLSGVDLKNIPSTTGLIEMKQSCLPLEIKWLIDLIVERFPVQWYDKKIPSSVLHTDYKNFLPSKCDIDSRAFGLMLKKNNFPGFEKGRDRSEGITWKIDRQVVYTWLKEKNFIGPEVILE